MKVTVETIECLWVSRKDRRAFLKEWPDGATITRANALRAAKIWDWNSAGCLARDVLGAEGVGEFYCLCRKANDARPRDADYTQACWLALWRAYRDMVKRKRHARGKK